MYMKMTLKQLLETMEQDHNFVATERMYKARFKEWGVTKNITADYIASLPSVEQQDDPGQGQQQRCSNEHPPDLATTNGHPDVERIRKYIGRGAAGLNKLEAEERNRLLAVFGSPEVKVIRKNARRKALQPHGRPDRRRPDVGHPPSTRKLPLVAVPGPQHVIHTLECLFSSQNPTRSLTTSTTTTPFDNPLLSLYPDPDYLNSSNLWPSRDPVLSIQEVHVLDFIVRFRLAHILREEGHHPQETPLLQACLDDLSHALQLTGPDNVGAITCFICVILCALEIVTSFNSVSTLSWLFDQLALICTQRRQGI
jgi:hypothetical protein